MTRAADTARDQALASGSGEPIARAYLEAGAYNTTKEIFTYEIDGFRATIKIEYYNANPVVQAGMVMQIIRGVQVAGTEYTLASDWYRVENYETDGYYWIIKGSQLPNYMKATVTGYQAVQLVIRDVLDSDTTIPCNEKFRGGAWQTFKFYPSGRSLILNKIDNLENILLSKYGVHIASAGAVSAGVTTNEIFFFSEGYYRSIYDPDDPPVDLNIGTISELNSFQQYKPRTFIWTDENGTTHTTTAGFPIHNMGYIESTVTPVAPSERPFYKFKIRPNLRLQNFDNIQWTFKGQSYTSFIKIREVYMKSAKPLVWYMEITSLDSLNNTEGGAVPSTIERLSNYTPLNTSAFDNVLSVNDNNQQAAMETLDDHDHDATYAPIANGVTNGDTHNHVGGDGGQISFLDLSNLPAAETQTNDIFRCDNPLGVSAFAGTIATLPGGATLTYNITSGQEAAMVPTSTSQLAKMRLYNTTRGTSALISNCVTGTNTITLTANVPAGWAITDVITIASQTVSGGGINWIDLEITSTLTGKSNLIMIATINSATAGDTIRLHPWEAFATSKIKTVSAHAVSITNEVPRLLKINSNLFSFGWSGTPAAVVLREEGYLS